MRCTRTAHTSVGDRRWNAGFAAVYRAQPAHAAYILRTTRTRCYCTTPHTHTHRSRSTALCGAPTFARAARGCRGRAEECCHTAALSFTHRHLARTRRRAYLPLLLLTRIRTGETLPQWMAVDVTSARYVALLSTRARARTLRACAPHRAVEQLTSYLDRTHRRIFALCNLVYTGNSAPINDPRRTPPTAPTLPAASAFAP